MGSLAIVKKFKEFGLSPYETKSYLSLLEKDTLSVTEVAKLAQIPRTNAYEALEKLLTKGFCVSRPGKIRKFSAVDPASLENNAVEVLDKIFESKLSKLYEEQDSILAEKKAAREGVTDLIDELAPLYKSSRTNGSPLDYIEIIKDSFQMHRKFLELIDRAKHEILIFTKPPYAGPRKVLEEQTEKQSKPLRQGITIKSIYEIPGEKEEFEWWYNDIDFAAGKGEESRVIKELPMKMVIIDEKLVMLPLIDPVSTGTSFTAQIVEHASLAKGLKILFETMWERADDYLAFGKVMNNK